MSAGRVGLCRQADAPESAGRVGTCQHTDPAPVGRPTSFLSACRHPKTSPPRVPREPDDRPQKVAIPIDRLRRTDRTSRHLPLYRPPHTRYNDPAPPDITTQPKPIERPMSCRYIDIRQRYGRWRGIRQAGPRWAGAVQTIGARCSMDGQAPVHLARQSGLKPRQDEKGLSATSNGPEARSKRASRRTLKSQSEVAPAPPYWPDPTVVLSRPLAGLDDSPGD